MQLWHGGRVGSFALLGGEAPLSPSGLNDDLEQLQVWAQLQNGQYTKIHATPSRAMSIDEVKLAIAEFKQGAANAIEAGFDGVEVHGANGYLLEQFMRDSINDRSDAYGGSRENRARLVVEVMAAIADEIGAGRSGIRLSPVTPANDAALDSDPQAMFNLVVEKLAPLKLAFIHVVEGATGGPRDVAPFDYAALRSRFKQGNEHGAWIVNNGYTRAMALDAVAHGTADMVAFGKGFISNPDLVRRLRDDAPIAPVVRETLYGGGAEGYIDYPPLELAPV
jgi:N-ethylmaleimide reductase